MLTNPLAGFAPLLAGDRKLVKPVPVPPEHAKAVAAAREALSANLAIEPAPAPEPGSARHGSHA